MISVKNVSKIYNVNNKLYKALDNITISFPSKGLVSIFGRSGSGKTTLLNIIAKHETVSEGEVDSNFSYDCAPIVFQDAQLIEDLDVKANLTIVANLYNKPYSMVEELLEKFGLAGFDIKKINQLSAGEKQRITIVRALLADSQVLLCDEPTANLDSENAKIVVDILKKISEEKLVIVATHDVDLFKEVSCDWYSFENGQIKESQMNSTNEEVCVVSNNAKLDLKSLFYLSKKGIRKNMLRYIFLTISLLLSFVLLLFSLNVLCLNEKKVKIDYNNHLEYKEFEMIYNHDKNKQESMLDFDYDSLGYNYIKTIYISCNITLNRPYKIGDYIFQMDNSPYKMICGDSELDDNEVLIPSEYAKEIIENTTFTNYEELIGLKVQTFANNNHIAGIYDSSKLYNGYMPIIVKETSSTPSNPKEYTWGRFVCYDGEKMTSLTLSSQEKYTINEGWGRTIENENEILIGLSQAREMVEYKDERLGEVLGKTYGTFTFAKPTYYQNHNTPDTSISEYSKKMEPITFTIVGIYSDSGIFVKQSLYDELADNYLTQEYRYGVAFKDHLSKKDYDKLSDKGIIDCTQYTEAVHEIYKDVKNISYITSGLGAFMFVISVCILCNYYSLSQTKKNKEIGILASFGVKKNELLIFMCTDIIFSACLAIVLANFCIPILNRIINGFAVNKGYSLIYAIYYSGFTVLISILLLMLITFITIMFSIFKNRKRNIVDMIYNR